ncbi:MAG: hypothetical protein H8E34_05815 [Bacteroidetes bacterium]|nr:hypothetical protein [Bacteroidota bacterium]MBL6943860.1 hypothetical protein [Bacteroidales bacterium]
MKILKILLIILIAGVGQLNAQLVNQVNDAGEKTGKWVKYFDNNKIKYEGQFNNDKPYGKFTYYYDKGGVKAVSDFLDDGVIAYNTTFYENGNLMAEGKYVNQQKDGIWKYYLNEISNPLISMETYVVGTLYGESITYYTDTGNPAEIVLFTNGKKDGKLIKYFPDGKLMTESYYKNGVPEGNFIHYHPDGQVQIIGQYQYGKQVGEWKYFDELGNPVDKDEFKKQEEVKEIK